MCYVPDDSPRKAAPRDSTRRDELAAAAADYALEHGLIGLSLRPLAAAIGTSDRMLLYHFADKDDLVASILRISNDRAVAQVRALPRSQGVRRAVIDLWAAVTSGHLDHCQRVYVEAAALGLLGREPYASTTRATNKVWLDALTDHLVAAGSTRAAARRAAVLLDAAFMGLQLDLPLDRQAPDQRRAVRDLADALATMTS